MRKLFVLAGMLVLGLSLALFSQTLKPGLYIVGDEQETLRERLQRRSRLGPLRFDQRDGVTVLTGAVVGNFTSLDREVVAPSSVETTPGKEPASVGREANDQESDGVLLDDILLKVPEKEEYLQENPGGERAFFYLKPAIESVNALLEGAHKERDLDRRVEILRNWTGGTKLDGKNRRQAEEAFVKLLPGREALAKLIFENGGLGMIGVEGILSRLRNVAKISNPKKAQEEIAEIVIQAELDSERGSLGLQALEAIKAEAKDLVASLK
jgi:hypothetical protein